MARGSVSPPYTEEFLASKGKQRPLYEIGGECNCKTCLAGGCCNPTMSCKPKMARPSPRTGTTGAGIQKFGTQQLKMLDSGGVIEKDVGARFRLFTGGEATTPVTPFSQQYQQQRPATIRTFAELDTSLHAQPKWEGFGFPDLTTLFPPASPNGNGNGKECDIGCLLTNRGCDCGCKDLKPCTTCDSAVCQECNAWDLQCEDCKQKDGTCTPPETPPPCDLGCWMTGRGCECNGNGNGECGFFDIGCKGGKWWDKYGIWVYLILGVIGLGILLWLLRPLFGMIGAFKGGSP